MNRDRTFSLKLPTVCRLHYSVFRIMLFVLAAALTVAGAQAQTITSIYDFGKNASDPLNPQLVGAIAQGRDGNMWSTTPTGGLNKIGAAFRITPAGKLTRVHDFDPSKGEGASFSGLTLGTDGNFYGTMSTGGPSNDGALFKMTSQGKVTILYSFTGGNDGKTPLAPPIQAANGSFWGTTNAGGAKGYGTVYEWTPKGLTTWVQFSGTDGANPTGPLIQGTDSAFWGTTNSSTNANGPFVVFRVTTSGNFEYWVYTGAYDYSTSGLIQGRDGNYYGTTYSSIDACGFVFRITPKGVFTDIHDFNCGIEGANPYAGIALGTDGNFYGVTRNAGTQQFGTFYEITEKGKLSHVVPFNGTNGEYPSVTLNQHTNGTLYGAAYQGGSTTNTGTFFKVTGLNFEKTPFLKLLPSSGKVGFTVEILGQGFTGTTAVSFNGAAAQFKVVSSTYMTATVPKGATSGFVTVTTPKAKLQSNLKFRVTK